jgi:hypothetical protein
MTHSVAGSDSVEWMVLASTMAVCVCVCACVCICLGVSHV